MVENYLDKDGKIFVLPRKKGARTEVYQYLASKFDYNKFYTEKEVNAIIDENHSFGDTCLLRRELIEYKFLNRRDDGTYYERVIME